MHSSPRQNPSRRAGRALSEALESRTLFNSAPAMLAIDPPMGSSTSSPTSSLPVITTDTSASSTSAATPAGALSVPSLSSLPGATATLYLNFLGDNVPTWGSGGGAYHPGVIPAYDIDGNATSFSATETANINQIWARIAEKYSPFKINVTTVDPLVYTVGKTTKEDIGGDGAWLGSAGGVAFVGGFTDSFDTAGNTAFIFPAQLANGNPKDVAEAGAHEAGHTFGLEHQSEYDGNGVLVQEYSDGDPNTTDSTNPDHSSAAKAPIMGVSYYSTRGLWYLGTNDVSSTTIQDDLAVITSNTNGFGYRADDVGDVRASATPLTIAGLSGTGAGIIGNTSDLDYFSFTAAAGSLHMTVSPAAQGGMLDATLEIHDANDNVIASAATSSLSESITFTLPSAGTYYAVVKSAGNYGDIGQYTLAATLPTPSFHGVPGGPYTVAEGSSIGLTGSAAGGTAVSYEWDFNYNGSTFNTTVSGTSPTFSATNLDGPLMRTIALRVIDNIGTVSVVTTTVTVTNVNPTATFTSNTPVPVTGIGTVTFANQTDPAAADVAAGFRYSYDFDNNGTFDLVDSAAASVTVPSNYLSVPGPHTIKGRIKDKDGGLTDYTTVIIVNSNPSAVFANTGPVAENTSSSVSFASPAGGSAPYHYSYDFDNDGVFEITNTAVTTEVVGASFLSDGPSVRLIHGRITDNVGAFTDYTTGITVNNVVPTAFLSSGSLIGATEGSVVTFSGSATDVPVDMAAGFTFSWTVTRNSVQVATFTGATYPLTLTDNGAYVVSMVAIDKDGGSSTALTSSFAVANVAPTASFGNGGAVIENNNGSVSFTGQSDASSVDAAAGFTYSYDFNNDGTFEITGTTNSTATVPAAFLTGGISSRTVLGRITDKDGDFTDYTTTIQVLRHASATFGVDSTVVEGTAGHASFVNPSGPGPYTYSYDFDNDGTFEITGTSASTATVPSSYFPDGPATQTIHGRIISADGVATDYTATSTVLNAPPIVAIQGTAAAFTEASPVSLTAQAFDVAADSTFGYAWLVKKNNVTIASGTGATITFTPNDSGPYVVIATAVDKDHDTSNPTTATIQVMDVPPTATFGVPGGSVPEGSSGGMVSFIGVTDVSSADVAAGFHYAYDFNNDGTFDLTSSSASVTIPAQYIPDGPATLVTHGRIFDKDNGFTDYTATVHVTNVAPTFILTGNDTAVATRPYTLAISATDPGQDTITSWGIDWGDGSTDTLGANPAPVTHRFPTNGEFLVYVTATDEDGTFGADPVSIEVTPPTFEDLDTTPPVAVAGPLPTPLAGSSTYDFSVTYSDETAIDLTTIGADDIQVLSPSGSALPVTFLGMTNSSSTGATAAYRFTAPGGIFNAASSGTYSFATLPNGVYDVAGNGISSASLGQFTKNVPSIAPDLATQIIASIPRQTQPGYKGTATIRVANHGDRTVSGAANLTLALSSNTTLESSDIRLYHGNQSLSLAPGQSKDFKVTFTIPASVASGTYFLMGSATTSVAELNDMNNIAVGPSTTISRPFVDLRPSRLSIKAGAHRGGKLSTVFQLTNAGTLAANGAATFTATLVSDPSQTNGITLGSLPQSLQLKPGAGKSESLSFTLASSLAPGTYYVLITVAPSASLKDTFTLDKQVFSTIPITLV